MTASHLAHELQALAARLEAQPGHVTLLADDLQLHPDALADLTEDPRERTAALVSRGSRENGDVRPGARADVRVRGGRVVAAASAVHRVRSADATFVGALRVADSDRAAAAEAARNMAGLAHRAGWSGDALDYLLVAMVRAGVPVVTVALDPWPWQRGAPPADREAFAVELGTIGPDASHRLRLARATKADDGAVATVLSRPLSRRLTPLALRLRLTPNQVTVASVLVGLAAAGCFATGDRALLLAGAVLLQLSLVVDCVDGDVARYTRSFSATGAWLDASTDRLKEFACYGGLAWGAGGDAAWLLAAAMLTLQTARHTVDYTFTAVKELREGESALGPLDRLDDGPDDPSSASARAVAASERSNRRPVLKWAKRALHLSIGERWLVLSVLAAAGRPRLALGVLLALGLVSLAYTSAGRVLRTRAWVRRDPSPREREIVAAQVDPGPLPDGVGSLVAAGSSRALWVRPALLRLAEYAALVALAGTAGDSALPAAYALLLVVASHHYDDLYRVLNGLSAARRAVQAAGLGTAGRLLLVAVLSGAGGDVLVWGLWSVTAALGALFLVLGPLRVLQEVRTAPALDGQPAG